MIFDHLKVFDYGNLEIVPEDTWETLRRASERVSQILSAGAIPIVLGGDHTILDNCSHICEGATVEEYVRTSRFTIIRRERTVGAYSFTAGYVEIDRDAPPYAMIHGAPFRVRGVNTRNLRRCGFDEEDIRSLKLAFRELFNGGGVDIDQEALRRFLGRSDMSPHLRRLAESVQHSRPAGEDDDA